MCTIRIHTVYIHKYIYVHDNFYDTGVYFYLVVCVGFFYPRCARVLTGQVTAEDLYPHTNTSRWPPLWKDPNVLGHNLIEPPHLRSIIVAVPFENLIGGKKRYGYRSVISVQRDITSCHSVAGIVLYRVSLCVFVIMAKYCPRDTYCSGSNTEAGLSISGGAYISFCLSFERFA